ncbi:MAG: HIT family protein [Parachlamydiaceae bacterium]|nr:HIT family protein [Parachlamydiaceae bacterium]
MSFLSSTRSNSFLSGRFGSSKENVSSSAPIKEDVCVYEGKTMKIIVPERCLGAGSMQIKPKNDAIDNISKWESENRAEAKELIQKVVGVWEKNGISDYLIYGKNTDSSKSSFNFEVIPYPKSGWGFWKQFRVLWNITFGGFFVPKIERERIVKDFQKDMESFSPSQIKQIASTKDVAKKKDAFCQQKIIDSQLVFEGKEVNVLYNYAPIALGNKKLHFLIVPKQHREKFSDLTGSEYEEASRLSQKLVNFYTTKGQHTTYLFNKTGRRAGQTVPHWHEHIVFTSSKTQDFFGKLKVLKNMLIGSSSLSKKDLAKRVDALKVELNPVLV